MMDDIALVASQTPDLPRTTPGKYCSSCHTIYLPPEAEASFCAKDGAKLPPEQPIFGGKYVLGERLGSGHMSEVYAATQGGIGRRVALKLLRSEHRQNPEMCLRFERESQIASSLDHPNAVTIFDSGHTVDGQSYISMELLIGETLDRLIQREAPMPVTRALELLIPVVRALAAAHVKGIVHRDLKPENVFIAQKRLSVGVEEIVKVLDFGIARVLGRKTRLTSTQMVLGTPHYMAPETLQGEEATPQSDVFAVGVILTEMLAKRLPWGETSRDESSKVMSRLVNRPKRLTELVQTETPFPDDLQPILDQFLSSSLEDRPADCAIALKVLHHLMPGHGKSESVLSGFHVGRVPLEETLPPTTSNAPSTVIQPALPTQIFGRFTSVLRGARKQTARVHSVRGVLFFSAVCLVLYLVVQKGLLPRKKVATPQTVSMPDASQPPATEKRTVPVGPSDAVQPTMPHSPPQKPSRTRRHRHQHDKNPSHQTPMFPLDTRGY